MNNDPIACYQRKIKYNRKHGLCDTCSHPIACHRPLMSIDCDGKLYEANRVCLFTKYKLSRHEAKTALTKHVCFCEAFT